jgi:hypothetical protein
VVNNVVCGNKFHKISDGLSVALEATFSSGESLGFSKEFAFPGLIYPSHEGLVTRVYHPARAEGDLNNGDLRIIFVPWVTNEAQFHRLVLRGKGGESKNITFARFPRVVGDKTIDEKTFGFAPNKAPFINLDFFGKRTDEFVPLFAKIDGHLVKIEAKINEDEVVLLINKVGRTDVPAHLNATYATV